MMDITLAVPLVLALVEVAKRAGMESKYAPGLAVLLGVVFMGVWGDGAFADQLFEGLIAGLSASGLWSGAKAMTR